MKKRLFISYAWDEEGDDQRVLDLAKEFNLYYEFDVKFDKWDLESGDELPLFMEEGISDSDYVLIICTELYKRKADERKGGSGYEARLMANEIFKNSNSKKFIPVLLNKRDQDNIPKFLEGKVWIDLSYNKGSKEYQENLKDLFATIIGQSKRPIVEKKSVLDDISKNGTGNITEKEDPIKIIGIKTEEITVPRLDGTRGSALYKIPFLLNKAPGARWKEIFKNKWNYPRKWTTMHRPGIATVETDKIVLDGTTLEEVQDYHRDTLLLCVDDTNEELENYQKRKMDYEKRKHNKEKEFSDHINSVAKDIDF